MFFIIMNDPSKVLCSIKTTQIIFLIYSETSNLTAITNNEKNQIEGERQCTSGKKGIDIWICKINFKRADVGSNLSKTTF